MNKILAHKLIVLAFYIFGWISAKLGYNFQVYCGKVLGYILFVLLKTRKKISKNNLEKAFPEKSISEIKNLSKHNFINLGITAVEISAMKFMSNKAILSKVKQFDKIDSFMAIKNQKKPLMILTSHFNNWELVGYYLAKALDTPLSIIVKKQSNKVIDDEINKIRYKAGNSTVEMGNAARKLIPVFQNNGTVAMIVDQSARGDKGVLYPKFFGIETATYASASYLTLKFRANMIFFVLVRDKKGLYKVDCQEIRTDDLECDDEGIRILTNRHVEVLESIIREHPEQWVWQHRRWKRSKKVENEN